MTDKRKAPAGAGAFQIAPEGEAQGTRPALNTLHLELLASKAVLPEVAAEFVTEADPFELPPGFETYANDVDDAMVIRWPRVGGGDRFQLYRPGKPKAERYRFVKDDAMTLGAFRPRDLLAPQPRVLIVEGTKQALAAVGYAPEDVAVYGISGCHGWSKDGVPTPDLLVVDGAEVLICLDADAGSNLDVYNAGAALADACRAEGASSVAFVRLPAGKKAGLDDVLGARSPERRAAFLARLLDEAKPKPADVKPKPKARSREDDPDGPGRFFDPDNGDFLVKTLSEDIGRAHHLHLASGNRVAVYRDGVFQVDQNVLLGAVAKRLGERFRPMHFKAVEMYVVGTLKRRLPELATEPILNCANGMLNLRTGELKDHSWKYLSVAQIPTEWTPDAVCPTYEAWLAEVAPGQVDDLEETVSQMLDPSSTPKRNPFLFGPEDSGKSTFIDLMNAIVGTDNLSSVTLHQLENNRFMPADLYGKMLNSAADLKSTHIQDVSVFKMMSGADKVHAEHKGGQPFSFTNRALFLFSANVLPTVGEASRAYVARIKPFEFPNRYTDRADLTLKGRLLAELPGILVRLVRAWQRVQVRGALSTTDQRVRAKFDQASDQVSLWLAEAAVIHPAKEGSQLPGTQATTKRDLYRKFKDWALENGYQRPVIAKRFGERLEVAPGVVRVYRAGIGRARTRAVNVIARTPGELDSQGCADSGGGCAENVQSNNRRNPALTRDCADVQISPYSLDGGNTHTQSDQGGGVCVPVIEGAAAEAAHLHTPRSEAVFGPERAAHELHTEAPELHAPQADPLEHLLRTSTVAENPPIPCECGIDLAPVPPHGFWYACPGCHPETFDRSKRS